MSLNVSGVIILINLQVLIATLQAAVTMILQISISSYRITSALINTFINE
jgi:hypothetical protein